MVYTGGVDEVGKESASEYSSIGKATEEIPEKRQPEDPGEPGLVNTKPSKDVHNCRGDHIIK